MAEVIGYGFSSNGDHISVPNVDGPKRSLQMAIKDAGIALEQINYINAHATSTPVGDLNEAKAIAEVFEGHHPYVTSTKSMTGHLLGAAGGMEAIVTALSVQNDFVHKTINYTTPDPECDLDYCVDGNREMPVYAALSNSLGFGGHNATICIKKCD